MQSTPTVVGFKAIVRRLDRQLVRQLAPTSMVVAKRPRQRRMVPRSEPATSPLPMESITQAASLTLLHCGLQVAATRRLRELVSLAFLLVVRHSITDSRR